MLDLLQRQSQEFEGHDLFQPLQVALAIHAITRTVAARTEQPQPVVMVQRSHRHARLLREFLNGHEMIFAPDVTSESRKTEPSFCSTARRYTRPAAAMSSTASPSDL